jgi:hypothetical protein
MPYLLSAVHFFVFSSINVVQVYEYIMGRQVNQSMGVWVNVCMGYLCLCLLVYIKLMYLVS